MSIPQKQEIPGSSSSAEQKRKFKPELNRYRMHRHSNSDADDFIYAYESPRNSAEPLVPVMAGQTKADPNYYIDLSINGFGRRYLTVLEYVVSGSGIIYYNRIKRTVSGGYFYILHPTFTGRYCSDPKDPFVKKWANISGKVIPALMKAYGWSDQATIFRNCPKAEYYMDQIHDILINYSDSAPVEDDRKIIHIIVDLFDYLAQSKRNPGKNQKTEDGSSIEKILTYIDGNLAYEKITVETLSRVFHISQRSLSRWFKKELGVSPGNYLTSKKIELAQRMLTENYSVEEISENLFFSSAEYFRKIFVSVCGISPQKWKKKMQAKK